MAGALLQVDEAAAGRQPSGATRSTVSEAAVVAVTVVAVVVAAIAAPLDNFTKHQKTAGGPRQCVAVVVVAVASAVEAVEVIAVASAVARLL